MRSNFNDTLVLFLAHTYLPYKMIVVAAGLKIGVFKYFFPAPHHGDARRNCPATFSKNVSVKNPGL